jgi:hypothetical protein
MYSLYFQMEWKKSTSITWEYYHRRGLGSYICRICRKEINFFSDFEKLWVHYDRSHHDHFEDLVDRLNLSQDEREQIKRKNYFRLGFF